MAEHADGMDAILVAAAGGKPKDGKMHRAMMGKEGRETRAGSIQSTISSW